MTDPMKPVALFAKGVVVTLRSNPLVKMTVNLVEEHIKTNNQFSAVISTRFTYETIWFDNNGHLHRNKFDEEMLERL